MRYALVTGTSSGIGREIALDLSRIGIGVFAGVRREADGAGLAEEAASRFGAEARERIIPLRLDITDAAQIRAAVDEVAAIVGSRGLWALVNNAGVVVPGPIERLTPALWREQFEVNVFGLVELTRTALPLVRLATATDGLGIPRIMFVSSIGGRVAQPMVGAYTASKFAVTAIGDSLRLEVRAQGIGVTVLEPGAVATPLWEKGERHASRLLADDPPGSLYHQDIEGLTALSARTAATGSPPSRVARIAVDALTRRHAPARVLAGTDAKVLALLRHWLPLSVFDRILAGAFGIELNQSRRQAPQADESLEAA